jgi:putative ABC transport system permease protein
MPASSTRESLWSGTVTDMRLAARNLLRAPGYAATVVIVLALGIGAATAAYTMIHRVLLDPLPYTAPNELVTVWTTLTGRSGRLPLSFLDYQDYRQQNDVFSDMGFLIGDGMTMRGAEGGTEVVVGMVSDGYFPVLGMRPAVGRLLEARDFAPGAPPVAVVGYRFWTSHFAGSHAVIGQTVSLSTGVVTVVGVLARGEGFPEWAPGMSSALYVPIPAMPYIAQKLRQRSLRSDARVVARLKSGVSIDQARPRLGVVATRLAATFPAADSGLAIDIQPLKREVVGDVSSEVTVLAAAVSLVFLLACLDAANLTLVRVMTRRHELAVRVALGADRRRIAHYLLTESALLAGIGALAGTGLAIVAIHVLTTVARNDIPRIDEIQVDGSMLLIAIIAAVTATMLCSVLPLAGVRRTALATMLNAGARQRNSDRFGLRWRWALVNGQLAIAMMLLVGAALLLKTFAHIRALNYGYDDSHLIVWTSAYPHKADNLAARLAFYRRELDAVSTVQGVQSAAIEYEGLDTPVWGDAAKSGGDSLVAALATASTGFFSMIRIPLLHGREFTDADMRAGSGVAIVSRVIADRLWPSGDAVGHRVRLTDVSTADPDYGKPIDATVIGVVGEVKRYSLTQDVPSPLVYLPYTRVVVTRASLVVRTAGAPSLALPAVRRSLLAVDPDAMVSEIAVFSPLVGTGEQRFAAGLLNASSCIALVLALLGLYGIVSFVVTSRTGEIGIRLALGAQTTDVVRLFVAEAIVIAASGLVCGAVGGVVLGRLMRAMLYGVGPTDVLTFLAVAGLLAAITLVASYVPARRGSRVDPAIALRAE